MDKYIRPTLAEFVGTALYVFVVCLFPPRVEASTILPAGVLQGCVYACLILGPGKISGGYFNPVITASVTLCGGVTVRVAVCYFFAQILGGLTGAALSLAILPSDMYSLYLGGSTTLVNGTEPGWGLLAEGILTFILVLTVLMVTIDENKQQLSPLVTSLSIVVGVMSGASLTGGSMNPARSLGPAVCYSLHQDGSYVWNYHYIYWVGPAAGAVVATLVFRFLFASGSREQYRPSV